MRSKGDLRQHVAGWLLSGRALGCRTNESEFFPEKCNDVGCIAD